MGGVNNSMEDGRWYYAGQTVEGMASVRGRWGNNQWPDAPSPHPNTPFEERDRWMQVVARVGKKKTEWIKW